MVQSARTLDDVLRQLDQMIASCRERSSRRGYFPALYRSVTREVRRRTEQSFFDDADRMRRLTVHFANRYLLAEAKRTRGGTPRRCWRLAFRAAERWWPIVLQHLLLGMNAHINFDLPLATVRTVTAPQLPALRDDFHRINELLASMVDEVQRRLARVWPAMRLLDAAGQRVDETAMNFNLSVARGHAWDVAGQLAELDAARRLDRVERLDRRTETLGRAILHPGLTLSGLNKIVRLGERKDVRAVIDLLAD